MDRVAQPIVTVPVLDGVELGEVLDGDDDVTHKDSREHGAGSLEPETLRRR